VLTAPGPRCFRGMLTNTNQRFRLSDMTKQEIKSRLLNAIQHSPHLREIKSVAIFGSYVNGSPGRDSDIDVLMEFTDDAHIGFFEYARIQRNLSESLGIQVDLVTPEALSKFIRPRVLREAQSVYQG
jgi:predicted nucleotidyltransferase